MERTRFLIVAEEEDVMRTIVGHAITGTDLERAGEFCAFEDLPRRVADDRVDCVVACLPAAGLPRQLKAARDARPGLRIVGLVHEGSILRAYQIAPHEHEGDAFGIECLTELIRGGALARVAHRNGREEAGT